MVYHIVSGSGTTSIKLAPEGDYGAYVPSVGMYASVIDSDGLLDAGVEITAASVNSSGQVLLTVDSAVTGGYLVITDDDYEDDSLSGYTYNDVAIDADDENPQSTVACVVAHNEGILISRTPSGVISGRMAAAVPNVIQVSE